MTAATSGRRPRDPAPPRALVTFAEAFREALLEELELATRVQFPSPRYRDDPVAFAREVLGVEPWSRQIEILELVRDHKRVAVASGHRVGKSHLVAMLALWFFCSYEDARVLLSSTTARQVDEILWRDLKMLRSGAGRCVDCKRDDPDGPTPCPHSTVIEGKLAELARAGFKTGFRQIVGYTAREPEAIAGFAGKHLLIMIDEASGVPDFIYEAMKGNLAGGARLVLFGNPTRNSGEFYDAFNKKSEIYSTLRISSEESPNVVAGHTVVEGLANREWIEEMRAEYGEDSPFYLVRVKGQHAAQEEGRLFSIQRIAEMQARWYDTPEAGRLYLGLDPAGPTGSGDESAFAPRRGLRVLELLAMRGLNEQGHVAQVLALLERYRLPRESPVVVMDRGGAVGDKVFRELRAASSRGGFELVGLRASDKAHRQPKIYHQVRDELAANFDAWARDGGAIPEDPKLEKELHEISIDASGVRGLMKLIPKDELRKILGRSPDRFDAVCLSAWEPLSLRDPGNKERRAKADASAAERPAFDPYAASRAWGQR